MRTFTVAAAVVMCATAVLAADAGKTQFSVTTSNLSYAESGNGSQWSGGVGLALSRAWSPQWSTELAVAMEQHQALYTRFEVVPFQPADQLVPATERRTFRVFPVDLTTQYRFTNSTRWTPYIIGGVRYVAAPAGNNSTAIATTPSGLFNASFAFPGDRAGAEIGAGTSLRITPHIGLRFDAIRLLRSNEVNYDPRVRTSLGVSFRF